MPAITTCLLLAPVWAGLAVGTDASAAAPTAVAEVTTMDGRELRGRLVSLDASGAAFATSAGRQSVGVRDLWRIRLGTHPDLSGRHGVKMVSLVGGGMLSGQGLSVEGRKLTLRTGLLGQVRLDLSLVGAIYLCGGRDRPAGLRRRTEQLKLPGGARDWLIAEDEKGRWHPVAGVLKSIADGSVTFRFAEQDRFIDLGSVRVIRLARVDHAADRAKGFVVARDGSIVPFESVRLEGSRLRFESAGISPFGLDLADAAELRFRWPRFVYLSDLQPLRVEQAGMFEVVFPYRRDASSAGGPIRLGGVAYAKGLGLHSRCALTYELDGRYRTFAALAGIDAAGDGRGNAVLKVLGDGKELVRPIHLVGGSAPVPVRCPLGGVKRLTVLVDFGPDGTDVGDHVSLAEARLVRP